MSHNQFLKNSTNVNTCIMNRSAAFYSLVGIKHARKEVSKSLFFIFYRTLQYLLRIPTI